jgi:choloylglycine hydrolase
MSYENKGIQKVCQAAIATLISASMVFAYPLATFACTGLTLTAEDGAKVYGRTVEWGAFDLKSRLMIVRQGQEFQSKLSDGAPGMRWTAKYGVVGIDALEKPVLVDGMNERGLAVGLFYLPGFTTYQTFLPDAADKSMGPLDVANYLLTSFASIDEVRKGIAEIRVVPVVEPALGFPAPVHFQVTEAGGKAITIEYIDGKLVTFDNPLGVITNAPNFDWHMTNLRNYVNLSPVSLPGKKIGELDFKELGAGSGMIGLPGDYTPPSRFVRAVAFSKTARSTKDGPETIYEMFRILDSFNVPLGAAEGSSLGGDTKGMRSATIWTSVSDTKNRVFYYNTQHNRRVRLIDLKQIDFADSSKGITHLKLDRQKEQDVEEIRLIP